MSLPTYAYFYNKDDELIAKHFVNVGWWIDSENLMEALMSLPWIRDAKYFNLYSFRFDCDLFEPPKDVPWRPWRDEIVNSLKPIIKQWERDNADLRQVLKKIYLEQNNNLRPEEQPGRGK